eukprot:gene13900-19828_t
MAINESPVLLVMDTRVDAARKDLPVTLYEIELHSVDGQPQQVFAKADYSVETSDAERIGVDQVAKILPSGKASGSEQLTVHLSGTHSAIQMLRDRITALIDMLRQMQAGAIPFNHSLVRKISSLVHSLPAHSDMPAFEKDYLTGVSASNDIVDKVVAAYGEKSTRGGRGTRAMM